MYDWHICIFNTKHYASIVYVINITIIEKDENEQFDIVVLQLFYRPRLNERILLIKAVKGKMNGYRFIRQYGWVMVV